MCQGSGKTSEHRFTLWLDYPAGDRLRIEVDPECSPQVLGSNLEAADAAELVRLVEQWSPPVKGPDPNGSVSSGRSGSSSGSSGSSGSTGSSGSAGSTSGSVTGATPATQPVSR
jgi:hypothetical protein